MLNTEICTCGSGLRSVRCCNADMAAAPDQGSLELINAKAAEAIGLFNEKKYREAEALALKILDLAPNQRMALRVLFEIRKAEGKQQAAEILARRLTELPAENNAVAAAAHLQLAQMLVAQGRHLDAATPARAAVKLTPRDANAHHVLGVVLTETGQIRAGEVHYRKAVNLLERDDGTVLANLAWNLKQQGRLNEAATTYEKALRLRPDNARGVGGFAQVEAGRQHVPQAIKLLDDALAKWSQDRTLRLLRALMDLRLGKFEDVINRLSGGLESLMPPELAARGQAAERLGNIEDAVAAFAMGRQMQRERYGQRYDPKEGVQKSELYRAFFTAERMQNLPRAPETDGPKPVFLLGFPGSGTSLLEQLLSKVSGFTAADQAGAMGELTKRIGNLVSDESQLGYPSLLENLALGDGASQLALLRDQYFVTLQSDGVINPDTKFVIDRAADNHWHLGLIKLLFPTAPIIHMLRHPLDVVLSNFAQDRKLEANCGVSMPALARHYDVTMSLIKHFRGQLTLRYLPLRYEALVADPAGALASIVKFISTEPLKLPSKIAIKANAFQPIARVPAHVVMQEPVHERSLYRHRLFEAQVPQLFSDIRPVLTPWIEALGYGDAQ
ncbi:MAG: hypothetical protein B7Z75_03525 [Acidocella sp. 20-57-95]|nr:MAG: hypothetical protein B7Z75_03525 [Acidocella sp. 20-57-95]OYV57795.1 MAG: hypothetical protein B7Z71_12090 [Acidocella sp. 21-58-7]HQT64689.1 sulfotransferase [Acidocella sp.]HQU04533.1 sulfotransferase [Acidocella sp.]